MTVEQAGRLPVCVRDRTSQHDLLTEFRPHVVREPSRSRLQWRRAPGEHALEDWATRTFNAWRIGRKDINDGVALFVFSEDRKLRIEVGLGLEQVLTNAVAARIIREVAVPKLRAGDQDGAIAATVDALLKALERD